MGKDLVVKGVQQDRPFPILLPDLQHRHVRNNNFNGFRCVPMASYLVGEDMTLFARRMVSVLSGFGANPGLLAALMGQMVGKHPSGLVKNVSGQTVVTVGRMLFMSLLEKLSQENTVFLIAVKLTLPAAPFVIARSVNVHDPAQKIHRILHSEFFDDFVIFPLPVTYSLFTPAPSTQYPFFNRAISTSCFATRSRSRSTSLSDLLV